MANPDINFELGFPWGVTGELAGYLPLIAAASNVVIGTNPPYSVTDLFSIYPKFGGVPTLVTGTIDQGSPVVSNVSSIAGLLMGQYVTGPGIAPGSTIVSAAGASVTLSAPAKATGGPVQLTIYTNPIIPAAVLNAYVYLATSSIMQARWGEMWFMAMALYIAHFSTLWAQGEASGPNATGAQVAATGLALGIKTSKAAGDVSVGSTPILIDGAGAWNLTLYGQELATWAAVVGSGSALIY